MNLSKEKDKNFLPDGAKVLLEGIHDIILTYRKENNLLQSPFATEAGLNKNSLGVVEKETYTDNGRRSTIDLFTLVKILNQYPQLKTKIGAYLSGNKQENITLKDKIMKNQENGTDARETFYRDLIENNPEYSILPKTILRDYKIVPDKMLDIITTAKDEVAAELKIKNQYLVDDYERRIKALEAENEDLRRQIPPKK